MANYIQHPALLGAQMAGDLTKQRMNLIGQGVTQAVDALNKQAAADTAFENELLKYQSLINARINPAGGAFPDYIGPQPEFAPQAREAIMQRRASMLGVNPYTGYLATGPNVAPAFMPPLSRIPGSAMSTLDRQQQFDLIRRQQPAIPASSLQRILGLDVLNTMGEQPK
jgi:hypothetical protein